MLRRLALILSLLSSNPPALEAAGEVNLVFMGDTGTGQQSQWRVGEQIDRVAGRLRIGGVVLLGDNIYGRNKPQHFGDKFLKVYESLLSRGVPFHASLGNHDLEGCRIAETGSLPRDASAYEGRGCTVAEQLGLPEFGYVGAQRYYSFSLGGDEPLVEVFVLDSNSLLRGAGDPAQIDWLREALQQSKASWRFLAFHHPVLSPKGDRFLGFGHESEETLGHQLDELLGQVDAVFQAHNHLYARLLPREGVRYFVTGGGGQDPYRFKPDMNTVDRADRGKFNHFLLISVTSDRMEYCAIDAEGQVRDGGGFAKREPVDELMPPGVCSFLAAAGR